MLDDTCYFIGFENIEYAVYAIILLNAPQAEEFLRSITFPDAKRVFTKEVLMRIDLLQLTKKCPKQYIGEQLLYMNKKYNLNLDLKLWDSFIKEIMPAKEKQLSFFGQ